MFSAQNTYMKKLDQKSKKNNQDELDNSCIICYEKLENNHAIYDFLCKETLKFLNHKTVSHSIKDDIAAIKLK